MIHFCKYLYSDISSNVGEWASFVDYPKVDTEQKRRQLLQKLEKLKQLISESEPSFGFVRLSAPHPVVRRLTPQHRMFPAAI